MTAVLEASHLSVDIALPGGALHALSDVSFTVEEGETFCLVGESGCGKTMTSLAAMRLLPRSATVTAERLAFEGTDLLALSERQMGRLRGARMGMIFQDPMTSLNPVYRIGDQMEEVFIRHRHSGRKEATERAYFLLERVGIASPKTRMRQYPHELSGGLRQRVMIAMTLMCEPALLIADEPTTALDVTVQVQILQLLKKLQAEFGMTMIMITHDLGVVSRMADRVAVMYAGRIVEQGSAADIFSAPRHPYTRALLDCIPHPGGGKLGSIPGVVPSLIGESRGCAFRNRCAYALPACAEGVIPLRPFTPEHDFRCIVDLPQ